MSDVVERCNLMMRRHHVYVISKYWFCLISLMKLMFALILWCVCLFFNICTASLRGTCTEKRHYAVRRKLMEVKKNCFYGLCNLDKLIIFSYYIDQSSDVKYRNNKSYFCVHVCWPLLY